MTFVYMLIFNLPVVAFHFVFAFIKIFLLFVLFVYHTNPNAIIGSIVSYFFLFVVAFDGVIDNIRIHSYYRAYKCVSSMAGICWNQC